MVGGIAAGATGYLVGEMLDDKSPTLGSSVFAGVVGGLPAGAATKLFPRIPGRDPFLRKDRSSWADFGKKGRRMIHEEIAGGAADEGIRGAAEAVAKACGCN